LSVTIKLPTSSDYSLELDPLAHEIDPEACTLFAGKVKVELKLKKKMIGIQWGSLEGEDDVAVPSCKFIHLLYSLPSSKKLF
jgi:suppressor of G2 allele of SKP1